MSLSIQLPDNLKQQLSVYCQERHLYEVNNAEFII
jgi:hypothetical protein